jgi:peptide/nickel transport system substrate-binding protein
MRASVVARPVAALACPRRAQTLRAGAEAGPTSLDPHGASLVTNTPCSRHVFQPLVQQVATRRAVR